ncbi:c-type cytochrome [Aromatoleum sp.]|uniref:c-type cytochrome n=1 Tax=Aromatoleum sp. TaxID=2307007 RepID=UPI002FC5E146
MSKHLVSAGRRPRILPLVAVLAVASIAGCGKKEAVDPETTATLIQPVARLQLKVATVAPGSRTGEQIYTSVCASCHGAGVLGAPKTGDNEAWAPRIAQGFETLASNAINGIRGMPPRGGAADLTDTEVRRAVAYLANTAGANFTEPPVQQ